MAEAAGCPPTVLGGTGGQGNSWYVVSVNVDHAVRRLYMVRLLRSCFVNGVDTEHSMQLRTNRSSSTLFWED